MCGQVVCERFGEDKLCVSKLCDDKLCVDKLCGRCGGGRREADGGRTDGGIQNQKQEPHTKMWGKMLTQILPRQLPTCPSRNKVDFCQNKHYF